MPWISRAPPSLHKPTDASRTKGDSTPEYVYCDKPTEALLARNLHF